LESYLEIYLEIEKTSFTVKKLSLRKTKIKRRRRGKKKKREKGGSWLFT